MVLGHARSVGVVRLRVPVILPVHIPVILVHAARHFHQAVRAAFESRQHEVLFGLVGPLDAQVEDP